MNGKSGYPSGGRRIYPTREMPLGAMVTSVPTMRKPLLVDVLLAVLLTGLALATLAVQTSGEAGPALIALAVLSVAPIAARQLAPVATMLVIVAALSTATLLGHGDFPSGGIGLLVAMFTVATLRPRGTAALLFTAAAGLLVISYVSMRGEVAWSLGVQAVIVLLGAWFLGESTRRWSERAERLAAEAARAVAEERVRIARELHDIVAHHMSVISLQAGLAEFVLDADPPTARNAIATVSDASREAMLEMRRLLDVLRVGRDEEDDYQPQPGLAQLEELVARTRAAGLPVTVTVTGDVRELPAGPDLCAYRTIQESLTNVLKHAGPANAAILVEYGERTLTVRVSDDGRKVAVGGAWTGGEGIRGMRERAELYGGVLTAGSADRGGFVVLLRLPLGEEPLGEGGSLSEEGPIEEESASMGRPVVEGRPVAEGRS